MKGGFCLGFCDNILYYKDQKCYYFCIFTYRAVKKIY